MLHLVSLVLEFLLIPSRVSFLLSNTFLVLSFAGNRVSECGQSSRSRDIKNEVTTVEIIKDSVYLLVVIYIYCLSRMFWWIAVTFNVTDI